MKPLFLSLTALCLATVMNVPVVQASPRPIHPGYVRALVSLRQAQQLLGPAGRAPHTEREKAASQVEAAIWQVEQAAMVPMKATYHPQPGGLALQQKNAVGLLQAAQSDCEGEFDDLENPGVRDRALRHINAALFLAARAR